MFDQLVVKRSGHLSFPYRHQAKEILSLSLPLSLGLICVSHRADVQHTHTRVHILLHLKVNEKLRCVYMCVLLTEWDKKGVSKHSNRSSKNWSSERLSASLPSSNRRQSRQRTIRAMKIESSKSKLTQMDSERQTHTHQTRRCQTIRTSSTKNTRNGDIKSRTSNELEVIKPSFV